MPLRTRLFIILSVIIAIILVIGILLLVNKKKKEEQAKTATTTVQTDGANQVNRLPTQKADDVSSVVSDGTVTIVKQTTEDIQKNTAKQIAKVFTERYGSFSNQNDYQNILDIEDLSTTALYSELSKIMSTSLDESIYYGITTNVVSMNISKWTGNSATITLNTVRNETKNSVSKKNNRDAVVEVIKSNGNWLVSNFKWK